MIQAIRKRLNSDERGFTLIELMVVVLIIAILIAIAIPTFLGARERAQDRAAQSDLRNSLLAGEVWYTDNENYSFNATNLADIEPELTFVAAGSVTTSDHVGFVSDADNAHFVRLSAGGTYFAIRKNEQTGTSYCSATTLAAVDALTDACTGTSW